VANILDRYEKYFIFNVVGNSKNYGLFNPFPQWSYVKNSKRNSR